MNAISTYSYEITPSLNPVIELYRLDLYYGILNQIHSLAPQFTIPKLNSLLGQFLANTVYIQSKGQLTDGLFNLPSKADLEMFYGYIKVDNLDLTKLISDAITSLQGFSSAESTGETHPGLYTFDKSKYTLNPDILQIYDLSNLIDKLNDLDINSKMLSKLKSQFTAPSEKFTDAILCLILRYQLVDIGISPYQIDPKYKAELGFETDCISTPFNSFYNTYFSTWYDLDQHFGSKGIITLSTKLESGNYFFDLTYNKLLLKLSYDKIKESLKSPNPLVCILNIPKLRHLKLEDEIVKDKLYHSSKLKYEYFTDPSTSKQKLCPPYISYLFSNQSVAPELKHTFESFENYHLEMPVRNQLYDNKYKIETFKKLLNENLQYTSGSIKNTHKSVKLEQIDYTYQGEYHYLGYDESKWMLYLLSDLFNDHCRVKCNFAKAIAPIEYFEKHKDKLIEKVIKRGLEVNPINLREEVYQNTIECSTHNPLIIKAMIKMFKARKVLDPSSGWGDRLIGAMLSSIDLYLGVDPNECLHPGYQEIIKLFTPLTPNSGATFMEVNSPFEKYQILEGYEFDLAYSSPPYFDYETYTDLQTQSMHQFNTEDRWYNEFLLVYVNKCIEVLKNGGHMAWYISQERGKTYVERLIKYLKGLPEIYYLGNIFYGTTKLTQLHPIFIFEKNKEIPIDLWNPPLTVRQVKYNNLTLNVIRDDLIIGGSKVRAAVPYIQSLIKTNSNLDEIIFIGAQNGYGQLALAYTLYLLKRPDIKLTLYYISKSNEDATKIKSLVRHYHPNTVIKESPNVYEETDNYLKSHSNTVKLGFGLQSTEFMEMFSDSVRDKIQPFISKIKRLWVIGGSATIYNILFKLLPNTFFNLVQVGKKVELTQEQLERTKLYISTYKLSDPIEFKVPYPTTPSYDGKLWEFREKFEDYDYLFNVAGVHMIV